MEMSKKKWRLRYRSNSSTAKANQFQRAGQSTLKERYVKEKAYPLHFAFL